MALDQAQIDALEEGFRRGSISADEFARAITAGTNNIKDSSSSFATVMKTAGGQVFGGVTSFTKSMANGAQGASAFSGIITATTTGLSTMLSKANIAGTAISKMAEFGEGYVVQALKQSDDLFTAFQGLSKVGGASEEGMKGVFDNMQKFGMTMNELPQFGAMIAQNSEALAKLGGSVSQGTKTFANVAAGIQQSGLQAQFERMGLTIQAQNEGTASYLRLEALRGANANKSQAELTAGAAEYIRQQDRLTKLTGKSADTLAKEEEARLKDQRYAAVSRELQQKADAARLSGDTAGQEAAEKQLAQNKALLDQLPDELKAGAKDLMSGFVNSPEAQKLYTTLPNFAQAIMSQNFDASKEITAASKEATGALDRNAGLAKAGLNDAVMSNYSALAALEAKNRVKTAEENDKAAKDAQDKLRAGAEVDVNNQVALRDAQRATTTAMDNLVNIGVGPLTSGMETLATKLAAVVTNLPGAGEKTPLNREPTAKEAAQGITKQQLARGEYAEATAGYESKLKIDVDKLGESWDTFIKKVLIDLSEGGKKAVTKEPTTIRPPAVLPGPSTTIRPPPRISAANLSMDQVAALRGAGPAYSTPTRLEETRLDNQTQIRSSAAGSTTELATVFSDGFKMLSRGQAEQIASVDELVDLMRKSVGVQGRILQTSRA